MYIADSAGALCRWDAGYGATSAGPDFITFDEPVAIVDVAVVTGFTAARRYRIVANGQPTRFVVDPTTNLNTVNTRPPLNVGFRQGSRIQIIEI